MRQLADTISQLPPLKITGEELRLGTVTCVCGKRISIKDAPLFNTGVTMATDNICPDCAKSYKGTCRVVCIRCRKVVSRIKPGTKDKATSMVFRADRCYHTDGCGECQAGGLQAGTFKSKLLELVLANKAIGRTV